MSVEQERKRMHQDNRIIQQDEKIIEAIVEENRRLIEEGIQLTRIIREQAKELEHERHRHHSNMRPTLIFKLFFNNKNFHSMSQVQNLTLISTAPVALFMAVVDANNNNAPIAGTLTNLVYTPADPTQDIAVVDPNDDTEVDVHAVTNTGGTTVAASGNFVSTLQKDDGTPAFSGSVTGQLVLVNNIPVAVLNPVLTFNQ